MERDIAILALRLGFIAALYFFLFQLLVVLWRDLRQPGPRLATTAEQLAPCLEVLEPAGSGRAFGEMLTLAPITRLGREEHNTFVLADTSVSAEHALVSYRLGQWWVEDLVSTNGTRVNDAAIDQPTVLRSGDIIGLGAVRLRVRV